MIVVDASLVLCKAEIMSLAARAIFWNGSPMVKLDDRKYKVERKSTNK